MKNLIHTKPLELIQFLSMEEHQVLVSFAKREEEIALIRQMEGFFQTGMSQKTVIENDLAVLQLLTLVHYHFLFSTSCQLRCHLSEAFASARVAIDATLIAAHIINDRASQVAYAKREKPFNQYTRYLKNLIRDNKKLPHPLVPHLLALHETISTFASHADVRSFVHRIRKGSLEDQLAMAVEYFQFSENDDECKLHSLTLLHTFIMCLDVFADFLIQEQKIVPEQWKHDLHNFGKTIERRADILKMSLDSGAS